VVSVYINVTAWTLTIQIEVVVCWRHCYWLLVVLSSVYVGVVKIC